MYGVQVRCKVYDAWGTLHSVHDTTYTSQHTIHNMQYTKRRTVHYAPTLYTVRPVHCTAYSTAPSRVCEVRHRYFNDRS